MLHESEVLKRVAELAWQHRRQVPFGGLAAWHPDTFRSGWFRKNCQGVWCTPSQGQSGWYWFETNLQIHDLKKLARPASLKVGGCDIGQTASHNHSVIGADICPEFNGRRIVYNGHEKNVLARIRQHLFLNNDDTGAIGLGHYAISMSDWCCYVFLAGHIGDLQVTRADVDLLSRLANDKTGRTAVEARWRADYGWPLLCKG